MAAAGTVTDAVDGDEISYDGGAATIHGGDEIVANARLDIAADAVWAILFEVIVR